MAAPKQRSALESSPILPRLRVTKSNTAVPPPTRLPGTPLYSSSTYGNTRLISPRPTHDLYRAEDATRPAKTTAIRTLGARRRCSDVGQEMPAWDFFHGAGRADARP